jgi:hypothetical protein
MATWKDEECVPHQAVERSSCVAAGMSVSSYLGRSLSLIIS